MKLYEHIDSLLMESPESLGFSKKIADEIRSVIPGDRKSQDYIAKYFKGMVAPNEMDVAKSISEIIRDDKELYLQLARAYGVRDASKPRSAFRPMTKLIHSNVKTIDDLRVMRKKLDKALKRMSASQSYRDDAQKAIDRLMIHRLERFQSKYASLIEFLKSDTNNYRKINSDDVEEALRVAEGEIREKSVEDDRIFIEFPDGYFWYEVADGECSTEGKLMGHCGRKSWGGSTMYSLRDPSNSPHVTIEYNKGTIIQLKGKGNERPKDKYTKYIKEFLKKTNAHIDEDWHTNGDTRVKEYLDTLTRENGSHEYSMFEQSMESLNRWLREQLTDLKDLMDNRFSRSEYLHFFNYDVDDSFLEGGELNFSVHMSGHLPIHLFKGEDKTRQFRDALTPYGWLDKNADQWVFNGEPKGGGWDRYEWIDGAGAWDSLEVNGFKLVFEARLDDEEGSSEEFIERVNEAIDSIKEGWTEENFIGGAEVVYEKLVEPNMHRYA